MYDLQRVEEAIAQAGICSGCEPAELVLRLRQRFSLEEASLAVQQISLRERARAKFSRAAQMWLTSEGLAQSSAEPLAHYHASRFPRDELVVDAGCGIGADLIALAQRGEAVGIERDALLCQFARRNLQAYGVAHAALVVHADLLHLRLEQAKWLFMDPSRRPGGERTAQPSRWQPDWLSVCQLASAVRGALVKTSPLLPDDLLPPEAEREYVSFEGECRELVVAFGACRQGARRSALVLPEGARLTESHAPAPAVCPPLQWIYDPDPAVVAAKLLPELAQQIGACLLHTRIAYLTAPSYVATPFARAYRLLDHFAFTRKRLFDYLRRLGAGPLTVKKRGVAFAPELLVEQWRPVGDRPVTVMLYRGEREVYALVTEPAS